MTITELIERLKELLLKEGDLIVCCNSAEYGIELTNPELLVKTVGRIQTDIPSLVGKKVLVLE